MTVKEKLAQDLKQAMKAHDTLLKSVVTLVRAEVKQREVDARIELGDEDILAIVSRQVKQRKDALVDFQKAGREDLTEQTKKEIELLSAYLPAQLEEQALRAITEEAIAKTGADSMKDMGRVIQAVSERAKGQASKERISKIAKELLQK